MVAPSQAPNVRFSHLTGPFLKKLFLCNTTNANKFCFILKHKVSMFSEYSKDPKTDHSRSGIIQKPGFFEVGFQMGSTIRKPNNESLVFSWSLSLDHFIYDNIFSLFIKWS